MAANPNKISQFWLELKRRNVHRLLAIYAGTGFVILEASTIIFPRWGLPDWTIDLVLYLLILGAIIAFVVSWIYDITPEGVRKTIPSGDVQEGKVSINRNGWKIASYISVLVIVVLIVLNIIPRLNQKEVLDKSIAVRPFTSLSDDPEKQYLADGVMDAILLHLSKIEDLRVLSKTSVEQYRNSEKTATEICEELNVSFLLEGSFQKYGDQARLIVQLIEPGSERHLWAKNYDRDWSEIFAVQSEVAKTVAKELQAVISPEVKHLIEMVPTTNLTAYDFYQQAEQYLWKYRMDVDDSTSLTKARLLYNKVLDNDPGFAQAYAGLAMVYYYGKYVSEYFSESFLDSVIIYADRALELDDQLAEAYLIKGEYYKAKGDSTKAVNEYNKVLKLNPNSWESYRGKGVLYRGENYIESIKNLMKAYSLYHGPELPQLLRLISDTYAFAGFYEHSRKFAEQALELDGDSIKFLIRMAESENWQGQYRQSVVYCLKVLELDSSNMVNVDRLAYNHMFLGEFGEALKYYRICENYEKGWNDFHRIAYVYAKNGLDREASRFFQKQEDYILLMIELERPGAKSRYAYYDLAGVYAYRGEKEKALENLRIFNKRTKESGWMVTLIQDDPLFDSIREKPEFQQIVRDMKAKYQDDYNKVRSWLEENEML